MKEATLGKEKEKVWENLYLLSALVKDGAAAIKQLQKVLEGKVEIVKCEDFGPKPLAFAVNKQRQLNLISIFFTAEGSVVKALQQELIHEEALERFLLTTWREDPERPLSRKRAPQRERERERVNV